jgi:hypothetical protein
MDMSIADKQDPGTTKARQAQANTQNIVSRNLTRRLWTGKTLARGCGCTHVHVKASK